VAQAVAEEADGNFRLKRSVLACHQKQPRRLRSSQMQRPKESQRSDLKLCKQFKKSPDHQQP
jgi:hypothetical protein